MLQEDQQVEEIIERVAALDIGKAELMCCVRVPHDGRPGRRLQEVNSYSTMTRSLLRMADRLTELGVTRVVMEATSDYWKPVYYLLEAHGFDTWLVNARDVKHLPGRPKTDKLDSVWLCKVAERQMIRPSFVPPPEIRRLRDITRYRCDLVETRTAEKQRVEKLLEDGILDEDRQLRDTDAGTPQGSILSPLLSNVALSVLDEYIAHAPGGPGISRNERLTRRRHGLPNYRLVRYADDWCLLVSGTKDDAEALREEIAGVLSTMGLRLSPEKTLITHIDEGLDFLGWHIQRRRKRGTNRRYVYSYPSGKAIKAVTATVKTRCRQNTNLPLEALLRRLNPVLQGWTAHFRPGVSAIAFGYLRAFTWRQVIRWLRRKHPGITWKELRRRFCGDRWWPADGEVILFNPGAVQTTRYRYRGTKIPSPWPSTA